MHGAEHEENLKKDSSGTVLVPQPSDDPCDPLVCIYHYGWKHSSSNTIEQNWPTWRKHCALAALSYGSLVCYVTGTIIAAGIAPIAISLNVSFSEAIYVLTTPVISM
jgi:hypothetical protein